MLQALRQRLHAVSLRFPAVTAFLAQVAGHLDEAAAVKLGVQRHGALLQRHGDGDRLEGGAGLIHLLHGLVAPLCLLRLLEDRAAHDLVRRLLHLGLDAVADLLIIVQVKVVQRDHAEDLAGPNVHRDGGGAVSNAEILRGLLQVLLHVILDRPVDRGDDAVAVLRVEIVLKFRVEHVGAIGVFCPHHAARGAGQHAVQAEFQTGEAAVFIADKADHMAGQ